MPLSFLVPNNGNVFISFCLNLISRNSWESKCIHVNISAVVSLSLVVDLNIFVCEFGKADASS